MSGTCQAGGSWPRVARLIRLSLCVALPSWRSYGAVLMGSQPAASPSSPTSTPRTEQRPCFVAFAHFFSKLVLLFKLSILPLSLTKWLISHRKSVLPASLCGSPPPCSPPLATAKRLVTDTYVRARFHSQQPAFRALYHLLCPPVVVMAFVLGHECECLAYPFRLLLVS